MLNSFLASSMPDVSAATRQSQQMLQRSVLPLPSLTPSPQLVLKRQKKKTRKQALDRAITSLEGNKKTDKQIVEENMLCGGDEMGERERDRGRLEVREKERGTRMT